MQKLIAVEQKTIESLTTEFAAFRVESSNREAVLHAQIERLNQELANLNETLRTVAGRRFSSSSESSKSRQIEGQLNLEDIGFVNEVEYLADDQVPEPTSEELVSAEQPSKSRKARSPREQLFHGLPVKEEVLSLPTEELTCDYCNTEMSVLGREFVREEIRITPAVVERVHIFQESYICRHCKEADDITEIRKAPIPKPLLKHSLASPSIVAYIMYQKYVNALPLNRQQKDFERLGITLNRSVQANWVNSAAMMYFEPIYRHLHEELLKREVLQSDETTCQVHHEAGRKANSKSYMWIHRTSNDGFPPIILYDYQPGRNGDYAANFLSGFAGYHQCDGFSGYNKLKNVTRIACLAHIRRKFVEAVPKRHAGDKRTPAEEGVLFCDKLFKLEKEFAGDTAEIRKEKRLKQSKPVLDAFWCWLEKQNPPSGSNLYKAVNYARNQKEYMNNFLLDGRCEISNALTENSVRPYTLIRKNSLFHDTPKGATASAYICSLMETAKASGLDVMKYLEQLLREMPGRSEPEGIENLMPWSSQMQTLCLLQK